MSRTSTQLALVALLALVPSSARAFHDGGVASCEGCHLTHNSVDGSPIVPGPGNEFSLLAGSASDVCLVCHAGSAGSVLGTNPLAPPPERGAGNFVFLLEDDLDDSGGGPGPPIPGAAAGHNVVAPGHGLLAETRHARAPGGDFPSSQLGCTSCHDPHGRDTFRMLWGAGTVQSGSETFVAPAPSGAGLPLVSSGLERRDAHSAYRSGSSAWCGNCHGRYHEELGSAFVHPIDATLSSAVIDQYVRYDGVLNPTGGSLLTAYLPEVPFEDTAAATGSTAGPSLTSRLSCLSCHRAHASSAPAAGRWDFRVATLGADGVGSGSWAIPNPYSDPSQPSLCWKCHDGGTVVDDPLP